MRGLTALAILALAACATAARIAPGVVDGVNSGAFLTAPSTSSGSLVSFISNLFHPAVRRAVGGEDDDEANRHRRREQDEEGAIIVIRFFVPPSEADDFEDAWMDLEDKAQDEKGLEIFDLKKTKLDNLLYLSYGEWSNLHDWLDHFESDHFRKFAKHVDERGIRWELTQLDNESEDLDDKFDRRSEDEDATTSVSLESRKRSRKGKSRGHGEQPEQPDQGQTDDWDKYIPEDAKHYIPDSAGQGGGKKGGKKGGRRVAVERKGKEEMAHVVFTYLVPPTESKEFVEAWTDLAERTLDDEKGVRRYTLRRSLTDNTRFYGYGTWESMEDYFDHFESKHLDKFIDFTEERDVVWFISPLRKIGHQDE